jgi:heme/copper-type cytochrome/quinol oxidase subunit 1
MHILGLLGMPRRQFTYPANMGWDQLNLLATLGAFTIALGVIVFLVNFFWTMAKKRAASSDPWDAFTLEWATTSPPPVENFLTIPVVRSRRPVYALASARRVTEHSASGARASVSILSTLRCTQPCGRCPKFSDVE